MDYKVDYAALDEVYSGVKSNVDAWIERLEKVTKAYNALLDSQAISGKTAENLKKYLKSTHGQILPLLQSTLKLMKDNCLLYKRDYRTSVDALSGVVISSSDLEARKEELTRQRLAEAEDIQAVNSTLSKIKDILPLRQGGWSQAVRAYSHAIAYIGRVDSAVTSLEEKHAIQDFENIQSAMRTLHSAITSLQSKGRAFKSSFTSKSLTMDSAFKSLPYVALNVDRERQAKKKEVQLGELAEITAFAIEGINRVAGDEAEQEEANDFFSVLTDLLDWTSSGAKGLKTVGKKIKSVPSDELGLTATGLSYLTTLIDFWTDDPEDTQAVISNIADLVKSSGDVLNGMYKYFEKTLDAYDAEKLNEEMGGLVPILAAISAATGTMKQTLTSMGVLTDADSSNYEKAGATMDLGASTVSSFKKLATSFIEVSDKALRFTSEGEGVNQILNTSSELKFSVSSTTKTTVKNIGAALTILEAGIKTISGGTKRAGEVMDDDSYNAGQKTGTIGIHAGMNGLATIINANGIIKIDGEDIADGIDEKVTDFVNSDSVLANYVNNEDNNIAFRFAAATVEGVGILGEEIGDAVYEGLKNTGDAICNTANNVFSWFSKKISGG